MNFTLGLPNGSMQGPLCDLLSRIGLDVRPRGPQRPGCDGGDWTSSIRPSTCVPRTFPTALLKRQIDCGICGLDCVVESELAQGSGPDTQIRRLAELHISRETRTPARVVLFGRPGQSNHCRKMQQ